MTRIVLAYSGGFASSVAIPWLAERYGAEVVTLTLDLGQERELAAVRERALSLGAVRAHVIDAREELVRDFVRPALHAGAFADGGAAPTDIARPLIAQRLIEMARMESATAVAHAGEAGSAGEAALHEIVTSLAGTTLVIAPAREWQMSSSELLAFARARNIHVPPAAALCADANVWGRVVYADEAPIPEEAFTLTRAADEGPDTPAVVDVQFVEGTPVSANGVEMPFMELIESLETIAGAHGVGRNTIAAAPGGVTVVETPAASVLSVAHRELERAVLGADLAAMKEELARRYAGLIASGRWFSDLREAIDAFARVVQPRVSGTVRVRLHKGNCVVIDRQSRHLVAAGASPNPQAVA